MTPLLIDQINHLTLEITSYCNARCPHCPRFTADGALHPDLILDHWNVDQLLENIELDLMNGLQTIRLEGDRGDPASHPDLSRLLDSFLIQKNTPSVIMITNGSIRNSIFWKEIGKKGKNLSVIFSIDGLQDTNHIYRVGINWDHVIRNAKAYINAGGKAIWKCIVFRHNQHQLEKIQQTAQDMGFAGVNFVMPRLHEFDAKPQWLIYNKGNFLGELLPPSDISYLDLLKFSKSFVAEPQTKKYQLELDKICPDLNRGRFYITYRHHVIPCCMMHNYLYETAHNPGSKRLVNELVTDLDSIDLSKKKFSEILRSKFYNNSLEEHFKSGPYLPVCSKSCKDRIVSKLKNIKINRKL